ncbi:MAG: hypothetical protein ABJC10_09795 [Acidobacteriota bacterium]
MFRRTFAIMLSGLLLLTAFGYQGAGAQSLSDQQATEKVKNKVQQIGVGVNARVEVKLKDHTQFRGYISDASQDSFTIVERTTGSTKTVSYADTSSVKKSGSGVSTKTWIILGATAVGAIVTWAIVKPAFCDGGNITRFPC